jgi:hypothetical protein
MRRKLTLLLISGLMIALVAGPALACGGLVAPNGSVNLVRTTTLAAYKGGVEHYVTSFEFTGGGGGKFGSIVPLPDVPTNVERGGRWTLQRLVEEVQPPVVFEAQSRGLAAAADEAQVLLETRVSALDIAVLKGGGDEVGLWAKKNGFSLPPDAPEVLDFYASRSPIFMAVKFNLKRAKAENLGVGDGIPVHVTIPTDQPWVPLRILGLGREPEELIEADVFLLTERMPSLLPQIGFPGASPGVTLESSGPASEVLLRDLRSDRGMEWLPASGMWLNYIRIGTPASELDYDLAVNVSGGRPSAVDAGLSATGPFAGVPRDPSLWWTWVLAGIGAAVVLAGATKFASQRP